MTTFNLSGIMDAIATTLLTAAVVPAGKAYAYPVKEFTTPCVIVGYPRTIPFDMTFKRGADMTTFPVWLVAGLVTDKASRDLLSGIIDGGAATVKAALEANPPTLGGVVSSTHVVDAVPETFTDAAMIDYIAMRFEVEVIT